MKVYLIKTPEYDQNAFKEVANLLSSFEGPLRFISSFYEFDKKEFYFLQYNLYPYHNFDYESNEEVVRFDPNKSLPLSWRELFTLCNYYRKVFSIEKDSFVVLLTDRKNALNWFSAVDDHRNIFVHTAEWNLYTKVNSKYPIAYQVAENVLQSLMNIDMINVPNRYCHEPLRGCMNDFCQNKSQIIIKLQTANICNDCMEKIRTENINSALIRQIRTIFNNIRTEFISEEAEVEKEPVKPIPMVVDNTGRLLLPAINLEINLTPIRKTLYLFFLSKPEGVTLSSLSDYNIELGEIYRKLRPGVANDDAKRRIKAITHPLGDRFNPEKSHINRTITQLINAPLNDFYRISGERGEAYKIKIPPAMVDVRF